MVLLSRRRALRGRCGESLDACHDPCMALLADHILVSVLLGDIVQLESENTGHITVRALWWHQLGVDLEEHVRETAAKVSAVDRGMSARFGVVNVLAAAAEQLDRFGVGDVRECNREQRVVVAEHSGAASEIALLELFQHFCESVSSDDKSGVDQAIQVASRLFDNIAHLLVQVLIKIVGDQVQSLRVVLDLRVQSSQVEAVQDVLLVDLAKVFIALGAQEPVDPVLGVVRVRSACVIIHGGCF